MTGYQEIASDASYNGQIVVLTYPLIGNYGVFDRAAESRRPWVEALVVRELNATCREDTVDLDAYLRQYGVPGISGVDTRALVRRLRAKGTLRGALLQVPPERAHDAGVEQEAVAKARASAPLGARPLVVEASGVGRQVGSGPRIALLDTGVKENQIRCLTQRGATVRVFPATASARDVLSWSPEGIVISNGPGDPSAIPQIAHNVKLILDAVSQRGTARPVPILGICLGHQLLGRASGLTTSKLPFGHRGANHPVLERESGRVLVTAQNHGFCVDAAEAPEVTHVSLYDGTVEGLRHKTRPVFCVQYHPEASAGPHDSTYLFEEFCRLMG